VGNPLGRTPDEPAHVVKALATGEGHVIGSAAAPTDPSYSDVQRRWVGQQTRSFVLAHDVAALFPAFPCPAFNPTISARCQRDYPTRSSPRVSTYVGTYEPYSYVPAGVLMRFGTTPWSAWILGRVGFALASLGLLAVGAAALWDKRYPQLALWGFVLAVTPTVLWLAGSINPSAVEISAAICFTSGLLVVTRPAPPAWPAWAAVMAGGLLLASTRALGPYFVGAIALLVLLARGRAVIDIVRRQTRLAAVAAGVVVVGLGLNVVWEQRYQPHLDVTPGALSHWHWERLPSLGREMVGVFGWLEWHMPNPVFYFWGLLLLILIGVAIWRGAWFERLAVVAAAALTIAVSLSLHSILPAQTGYDVYGRYVLPLAVALPLIAADVVVRRARRADRRPLMFVASATALAVAVIQGFAWFINARRFAVGTSGPRWFLSHAQWSPPGGWAIWVAITFAGTAALALAAATFGAVTLAERRAH
jgi:hypothetical protein